MEPASAASRHAASASARTRRILLVQARELFPRSGARGIGPDRAAESALGGRESPSRRRIEAESSAACGNVGSSRSASSREREGRAEGLRIARPAWTCALRHRSTASEVGSPLSSPGVRDASLPPLDPARKRVAQRCELRPFPGARTREVTIETLERPRRVAELGVMLGRGPQEAGLPGTQGRGAVEETERLFLRAAIRLRPQKARERRDRLDAVGLGGESFAGRTQGRRRAAGPRLGRRQREQRFDVSRRQSHGELELFPRRAQVPAGERPLSVGEREARFDGRARGRRGDRRGACLDLELPDARRDPGRRLPGAASALRRAS